MKNYCLKTNAGIQNGPIFFHEILHVKPYWPDYSNGKIKLWGYGPLKKVMKDHIFAGFTMGTNGKFWSFSTKTGKEKNLTDIFS